MKERVNKEIRATELRVIGPEGENFGVISFREALEKAESLGLDLIEVGAGATPPVAKIADFGKYQYEQKKKAKSIKTAKPTETKAIQIKIGTGDHDLEMKAALASKWLSEGHRIKIELYLSGRSKYFEEKFFKERLERVLKFITVPYKISEDFKKSTKGYGMTVEKAKAVDINLPKSDK